jgi:aryl-alcohol dehydrogenase-like predicted oxidoreductase
MAGEMTKMRTLGQTGIRVSPVGFGAMEFAGGGGMAGMAFPVISQEQKNAIIKASLDRGINWFDTAELYGSGVSEASLAMALHEAGKMDGEVVVATKWWPLFRSSRNIGRTIRDRLRHLDGYTISLYMVHQPFGFSSVEAEMDAMADLVEAKKIRSVGVSNFNETQMRRAHKALEKRGLPLAANQMSYSLVDRAIEYNGVLKAAQELGVTIIAYTPLGSGLLTGKYHRRPEEMQKKHWFWRARLQAGVAKTRRLVLALDEIALKLDGTAAQVALAWLLQSQGDSVVTIPGATTVRQAEENAGAMRIHINDGDMHRLNDLSAKLQ